MADTDGISMLGFMPFEFVDVVHSTRIVLARRMNNLRFMGYVFKDYHKSFSVSPSSRISLTSCFP